MRWNQYFYVGDDPINFSDPGGLGFFDCLGSIFNGVVNAISGIWDALQGDVGSLANDIGGIDGTSDGFIMGGAIAVGGSILVWGFEATPAGWGITAVVVGIGGAIAVGTGIYMAVTNHC